MHTVIFPLQYPKGLKGLSVATTSNTAALRFFNRFVLQDWKTKIEETATGVKLCLYGLEYHRLKSALDVFIPEGAARRRCKR